MALDFRIITPSDLDGTTVGIINDKVSVVTPTVKEYALSFTTKATSNLAGQVNDINRRKLLVRSGFGIMHLDFKSLDTSVRVGGSSAVHLFTLPSNAPTPVHLIEQQTFDGGVIYIEANSRNVFGILDSNVRYVENLVGFFK